MTKATNKTIADDALMHADAVHRRRGKLSLSRARISAELKSRRAERLASMNLALSSDLPVAEAAAEITQAIANHQIVVIAGETGSGKTTQIPKLLLQAGCGIGAVIGHTQPRRLAARAVAARIAEETQSVLGEAVGFAVRFSDATSPETLVKVMTDGLLLNEIRSDRFLDQYDAIIVDEAHERSLNVDFLLGYLKRLTSKRSDLKVVVTSATIDVKRFSSFFNDAPIIEVDGRTHPVEVHYSDAPGDLHDDIVSVLKDVEQRPYQGASDVLVFCSGEREIFELARSLRKTFAHRFEILPLYARLSFAEQRKVFQVSSTKRRIVLATNVAETSITVPNIGFVIDPGFARINRYSYRSKLQHLPIEPIAQASADQRKGRCGRIAPGVCFRLFSEQDFLSRPEFTDPEIRRVNLAGVVLQMQAFNLGKIETFPFIDPPDPRAVKDALRLLDELQALEGGRLTKMGRQMAAFPVDPRLARMLVESNQQGALEELLVVVSGLTVQDPRMRPMQHAQAADQQHAQFLDPRSDFMAWLKLWRWLEGERKTLSGNQFRRRLEKRFLNYLRIREWREVHRQLRLTCRDLGWRRNAQAASFSAIHESILSGSLSLIAQRSEKGVFIGARNLKLRVFPGSGLAAKPPKWIVAAEIAETARVYARTVAKLDPGWIERRAQHLVKRRYSEPVWSSKRGEVVAKLTLTLYGLVIVDGRTVSYGTVDPKLCRDLFIRDGLVAGDIREKPAFLDYNLDLVREVAELEAKGRRRGILVSDDVLIAFYSQRLPDDICRFEDLRRLLSTKPSYTAELRLTKAVLQQSDVSDLTETMFPTDLVVGELKLRLKYRFAPGDKEDGVSVVVPVGLLPELGSEVLEWSVPGFLPALVEQWLRSLPKGKRKHLAPLPGKVEDIAGHLGDPRRYRQGRLLSALQRLLMDWYRLDVAEADWDRERVDPHLQFYVRVVDSRGRFLRGGRNLHTLKTALAEPEIEDDQQHRRAELLNLVDFPERELRDSILLGRGSSRSVRFPGFVDQITHVDLKLFANRQQRDLLHRQGMMRLALLKLGKVGRYFRKELDKYPTLGLHFATLGSAPKLKDEILKFAIWQCYFEGAPLPSTAAMMESRLAEGRSNLAHVFSRTVEGLAEVLRIRFACVRLLDDLQSKAYTVSKLDIQMHLARLVPANVLSSTPPRFFDLLPRYLKGLQSRIEGLPGHVPKDQQRIQMVTPLEERLERFIDAELFEPARHDELRYLLEEVRLALFAEQIARQKVIEHPLVQTFGAQWKASTKRAGEEIAQEERRLGLA